MIERVIRKEPLKYDKLKAFLRKHNVIMSLLEKTLMPAAKAFNISLPPSELTYICEIFISITNGFV